MALFLSDLPECISRAAVCSWGLFKRGGSAELRSCNFRACKYFTGNDCGKPRKWHRLSAAPLTLYIVRAELCFSLLWLALCLSQHHLWNDLSAFAHTTDRWAADFLIAAPLVHHSKFPPRQSHTCLVLLVLSTRRYLTEELGDSCSRGLAKVHPQLSAFASPCGAPLIVAKQRRRINFLSLLHLASLFWLWWTRDRRLWDENFNLHALQHLA